MEVEAPYLEAIQQIPGITPGEKQKTINAIARQLADDEFESNSMSVDAPPTPQVPELLKPLVDVEVAKILRQHEAIIEALKNEDITVVTRALQATWFFYGTDGTIVNAKYFKDNVFPEVSMFARLRIIKNLRNYLKNDKIAADFFITISELYGDDQAAPLLVACDEDFAFKMILERKIILSIKNLEVLYKKYPNLIIKYLKLCKRDDDNGERDIKSIDIRQYERFLPEIANKHFDDFMDIYNTHKLLDVKLGKKAANTFIKTRLDLLVERPSRYLGLVSLKIVTQKLSAENFIKMFKNTLPPDSKDFNFIAAINTLKYYKPEREKINIILNTYRELYGKDLLDDEKLVDANLIKELPTAERIKLAKLKLQTDKDWHLSDRENSWRCYLPTKDSIPAITKEIAKTSIASKRGQLLEQLVYTCQINDDREALLQILNRVYDRHRNDDRNIFYKFLSNICNSFDLATLSSDHWQVLNKYLKFAEMQDEIDRRSDVIKNVVTAGMHYCLLNDLPIDDHFLRVFVDLKMKEWGGKWNILTKYPHLEKKMLDLCIEMIPKRYPDDNEIWEERAESILTSLATSIWDFNQRNEASNGKLKKLSIKDYPWLFKKFGNFVFTNNDDNILSRLWFLEMVKENERDLCLFWLRDLDEFWKFGAGIIADTLRKYPQRVIDNWKECFYVIHGVSFRYDRTASKLIRKSRWYHNLPIKFFKEALELYKTDPEKQSSVIATLALLLDGENYTKLIESLNPEDDQMDVDDPDAKTKFELVHAVIKNAILVNPPISLDAVEKFCVGDYLKMVVLSLASVCTRIGASKVISFAKKLTKKRVSVMKHGIRLIYGLAFQEEIYAFLTEIWNTEVHTSIRRVIFEKIYDMFCKKPDSHSWKMFRMVLIDLKATDDEEIFKALTDLSKIPNEYLYDYIKTVREIFNAVGKNSEDPQSFVNLSHDFMRQIDCSVTNYLPEKYCQELIKEHMFIFDYHTNIFEIGLKLTVNNYFLATEKYNEERFQFIEDFFIDSVKKYWNKSHPDDFQFYPMNYMVYKFFEEIFDSTIKKHDPLIFESLLQMFISVLQPQQDAVTYLGLVYSVEYHKSDSAVEFGTRIALIVPDLVQIFSPEYVIHMAHRLSGFLRWHKFKNEDTSDYEKLTIIDVLVNVGTINCAVIAANMLQHPESKSTEDKYKSVLTTLRSFSHPAVTAILNQHFASFISTRRLL